MQSEPLKLQTLQLRSAIGQARRVSQAPRALLSRLQGWLLYVLSAPLALASLVALASGNVSTAVSAAGAFTLMLLGARLNRRSMLEQRIAPDRRYTQSAHVSIRYVAIFLVACGTTLAAMFAVGHSALGSVIFGGLSAFGFHLAYGLPPVGAVKRGVRVVVKDPQARRALQQAERRLLAIERAAFEIGNRELSERLHRIAKQGGAVLDMLVQRPGDLFRAHQFF